VGSGDEITIAQLATMLCRIIRYQGELIFGNGARDGVPRKLLDAQRLRSFGLHESTTVLENGLCATYSDFVEGSIVSDSKKPSLLTRTRKMDESGSHPGS
jgi:GDP-L-fucose synthase